MSHFLPCQLSIDDLKTLEPDLFGEVTAGYYVPDEKYYWLEGFTPLKGVIRGTRCDVVIRWIGKLPLGEPVDKTELTPVSAHVDFGECHAEFEPPRNTYGIFKTQIKQWIPLALTDIQAPSDEGFDEPEKWPVY